MRQLYILHLRKGGEGRIKVTWSPVKRNRSGKRGSEDKKKGKEGSRGGGDQKLRSDIPAEKKDPAKESHTNTTKPNPLQREIIVKKENS